VVNTASVSGLVERISVAPVKSLGLTHPQSVELRRFGVVGDRRFWLVDADGRLVDGKGCSRSTASALTRRTAGSAGRCRSEQP
jgi:uncharacterized protein YcbX